MNGTVTAPQEARLRGTRRGWLDRSTTVLATVVASGVIALASTYVVLTNAFDARAALRAEAVAAAQYGPNYPRALPSGTLALAAWIETPAPGVRAAAPRLALPEFSDGPRRVPDLATMAPATRQPVRPVREPRPRPMDDGGLVLVARGMSPAQALTLARPTARPEAILALAVPPEADPAAAPTDAPTDADAVAAAVADALLAAPPADPAGAPVEIATLSPQAVAMSPRPASRPASVIAAAARAPARAPAVDVARAPSPEEEVTLARLEDPDTADAPRAPLIQPRAGANPCSPRLAGDIPRRPRGAAGGAAVMAGLGSGGGRDSAIVREALAGNIPDFLRQLQPVRFTGLAGGRQTEIVICVTPDYLAIGSDRDHVRTPLGLPAALRIADAFDMMLPTPRMVDAIYAQADLRLSPRPMTPGPQMSSTDYFLRHDATVDAQFARAGGRPGILVAGHKKDLVIANRLGRAPGRVAIYGWHRGNGNPIQPLSTVHGEYYADYSHGIRLVSRTAYVDGRAVDLRTLLTDGTYAGLLNSDGPLTAATVRLASL